MTRSSRRIATFLTIAVALQVSPFLVQVLHVRGVPMLRGWRMYERTGSNLCDVRFTEHHADGRIEHLPFTTVAGRTRRQFRRAEDTDMLARGFCAGTNRDVRMTVRCGDWYDGWVTRRAGERSICGGSP